MLRQRWRGWKTASLIAICIAGVSASACTSAQPKPEAPAQTTEAPAQTTEAPAAKPAEAEKPPEAPPAQPGQIWERAMTQVVWGARNGHSSVVFQNKVWVLGGWGDRNLNDIWTSSDMIDWQNVVKSAAWPARNNHTSVIFQDKIWVIGGAGKKGLLNDVWSSKDGLTWTQATAQAAWAGRTNHTTVVFKDKLWVIGGEIVKGKRKAWSSEVWSSRDGVNWTQATAQAPWKARNNHTSLVYDNKLWVIGGWGEGDLNDIWSSSDGANWTQVTANAPWVMRNSHSSVVFNDKMWILGGWGKQSSCREGIEGKEGNLHDVWSSTNGKEWTQIAMCSAWLPRNGHTSLVWQDQMWIIGGWSIILKGSNVNDMWYSK